MQVMQPCKECTAQHSTMVTLRVRPTLLDCSYSAGQAANDMLLLRHRLQTKPTDEVKSMLRSDHNGSLQRQQPKA